MNTIKSLRQRTLAAMLLSAALFVIGSCGQGGGPANKAPVPQVLRGVDPQKVVLSPQSGGVAVQLRLDDGARQRLGAKALPDTTARVDITFSGGSLSSDVTASVYAEEFVNGIAQFVVTNLPGGTITVSATVKDGSNSTLASGSQNVTVVIGQVTSLDLLLSTSSASGTGQVSLLIDTRPSATPSPNASIPPDPDVPSNGTLSAIVSGNQGPQIVLMDPLVGSTNTIVRLSGSGFRRNPGLSTVTFNGVPAKTYTSFPDANAQTAVLWHMDNDTNVQFVHDDSPNANDGNIGGAYGNSFNVAIAEGRMGKARIFNGANDTIWMSNDSSMSFSNGISIEAWIKPTDLTTVTSTDTSPDVYKNIVRQSGTNSRFLRFHYTNNTSPPTLAVEFGLTINNTARVLSANNTVVDQWIDGGWHYIAATYDNTTMRLYRDGVQLAYYTVPSAPQSINSETDAWQVGSWDGWKQLFTGGIDELRISTVDRSSYGSTNAIVSHWNANQNWSDVQIKVPVPAGATGSNIPVKVQVGNVVSNSMSFSVE